MDVGVWSIEDECGGYGSCGSRREFDCIGFIRYVRGFVYNCEGGGEFLKGYSIEE